MPWPSFSLRRLRLASGLVMFAYLSLHLINHALGIVSLDLAESGLRLALVFWRNPIAASLLYGAAAIHLALALWTLYARREWHLPWTEVLRLFAGFSFPPLLIGHAINARLGDALYGLHPSYASIIANLLAAGTQGLQLGLLAPGWIHGCLGLWITLRRYRTMRRLKRPLIALVAAIPLLAAAGFVRMALVIAAQPPTSPSPALAATQQALASWGEAAMRAYIAAIAAAFLFGRMRALIASRSA